MTDGPETSSEQLRGSSLLLAGRLVALGLNFAVQILIVRYLAKEDYGAFAYALSVATIGQGIAMLGLNDGVTRFVPLHEERGDRPRAIGTIGVAVGTVAAVGSAFVVLVLGLRGLIAGQFASDPVAVTVLMIMTVLAPIEAVDRLLVDLFSVFGRPGVIFARKYVAAPGLRLMAVLALVVGDIGVTGLAVAYVAAGVLGIAIFVPVLVRTLRERGLLDRDVVDQAEAPVRELFGFSLPLMTSGLVLLAIGEADAIMLGHLGTAEDVAAIRAVAPVARLNGIVLQSFGVLFTPLAARRFARGDHAAVNDLYWDTASWVAVLSFPLLAGTFLLADPLTTTLFGQRYASSGALLAVLALGYYAHAALGPNGMTLNVYALVRYVVTVNAVAAVLNVAGNLILIPRWGAMGAAVATTGSLIAHNLMKQGGLARTRQVRVLDRDHARVFGVVGAGVAALVASHLLAGPDLGLRVLLAGVVTAAVLALTLRRLRVAMAFPELGRLPIIGPLLTPNETSESDDR